MLGTLSTSTQAVFDAIGLNPDSVIVFLNGIIGMTVNFALWIVQVGWPYILGLVFLSFVWKFSSAYLHAGR